MKRVVYRNGTLRADFFRDIWKVEQIRKKLDARELEVIKLILHDGVKEGLFADENIDMMAEVIHYSVKGIEVPYIRGEIGLGMTDGERYQLVEKLVLRGLAK